MRRKRIDLPTSTTFRGREARGSVTVRQGKPPKLRFKPGEFLRYDEVLHEILFAYRLAADPHEWIFCLEERADRSRRKDFIGSVLESMGCGSSTPRIVYDVFRDWSDADKFFSDIPRNGDRTHVRNRDLLRWMKSQ